MSFILTLRQYAYKRPGTFTNSLRRLSSQAEAPRRKERRFVRLSGMSNYSSRDDMELFLNNSGISPAGLHRAHTDMLKNHSIWIYDAGSASEAAEASTKLNGHLSGLKLVRAEPICERRADQHVKGGLRHLVEIAPTEEQRARTVFVWNLPFRCAPRFVWGFFSVYDLEEVRLLRNYGSAYAVFKSREEAFRALRERANLPMQGRKKRLIRLSMVE